jgi:hypothetical protein
MYDALVDAWHNDTGFREDNGVNKYDLPALPKLNDVGNVLIIGADDGYLSDIMVDIKYRLTDQAPDMAPSTAEGLGWVRAAWNLWVKINFAVGVKNGEIKHQHPLTNNH